MLGFPPPQNFESAGTQNYGRARILIEGTRFPPFGFDIAEISSNSKEDISLSKKTCCAWILITGARFPLFGFDIAEISSNSKEDVSFFSKRLVVPGF